MYLCVERRARFEGRSMRRAHSFHIISIRMTTLNTLNPFVFTNTRAYLHITAASIQCLNAATVTADDVIIPVSRRERVLILTFCFSFITNPLLSGNVMQLLICFAVGLLLNSPHNSLCPFFVVAIIYDFIATRIDC